MSKTEMVAVKTDGQGDVTDSKVVWRNRGAQLANMPRRFWWTA